MTSYKDIQPVIVPPPGGTPGGLADRINKLLISAAASVINATVRPVADTIRFGLQSWFDELEDEILDLYGPQLQQIRSNPDLPEWARDLLDRTTVKRHPIQLLALVPIILSLIVPILLALYEGPRQLISYLSLRLTHPFRLPFNIVLPAARRHPDKQAGLYNGLFDQGWTRDQIDLATEVAQQRASLDQYLLLYVRGELSFDQAKAELVKQGWANEDVELVQRLTQIIPGVQDLITMAVKEAFNEQFAQLTNTDSEFPGEFGIWAAKQGLSQEWAKRYWRAHWQLPSAQMGFEMLHRGIISKTDLDALLKALDYAPYWRDKLTGISYNPYTRVDIRRMYNIGVIDRDGVKRSYLDIGYDDTHAENLTKLTTSLAEDVDKQATLSQVLEFYTRGILSKSEAIDYILSLDYPKELATLYLTDADLKKSDATKAKRIVPIHKLYVGGEIGYAQASTRLTALGYTGGEIQQYLDDWSLERESKVDRPSASQLEGLLRQDIIQESDYRTGLEALGYQNNVIDWLTKSTLATKAEDARKTAQAARTEQERLRTAKAKSDYAVSKAGLDVTEAEISVGVAETQTAMSERRAQYQADINLAKSAVTPATLQRQAADDLAALQHSIDELNITAKQLNETIAAENEAVSQLVLQVATRAASLTALATSGASKEELAQAKSDNATADAQAKQEIAQHNVSVRQAQQDLATISTRQADLTEQIHQRQIKLQQDLDIVSRLKQQADIESEYQVDLAHYTEQLNTLRSRLSSVKIEKAKLAAGLASSLAGA